MDIPCICIYYAYIYSIPVFATRLTPLLANKLDLSFFSPSSFLAIYFFHLAMSSSERQPNETIEPTVEVESADFFFQTLKINEVIQIAMLHHPSMSHHLDDIAFVGDPTINTSLSTVSLGTFARKLDDDLIQG